MQVGGRKRSSSAKNADTGVLVDSVWESRMKMEQGKGEVLENSEVGHVYKRRFGRNQSVGVTEKKKHFRSDPVVVIERSSIQLRKSKFDSQRCSDQIKEISITSDETARKTKSDSHRSTDEQTCKDISVHAVGVERTPIQIRKTRSSPSSSSRNSSNVGQIKSQVLMIGNGGDEGEEEHHDDEEDIVMEIDMKSFDVKVVNEEKKVEKIIQTPLPISSNVCKQLIQVAGELKRAPPPPISEEYGKCFSQPQNKLQNIVDIIMWRDVSRSAFVFGFGTFILLSSSFTKDLNFGLVSVISYMGLLYLAAIFIYRSLVCREVIYTEDSNEAYMVGKEEAIWLLELILPYLNEFLLKLRALFSGDPVTTMKLAILLFVLARCGSSITIWKMAKLGFFGVFTIPKICASYSPQLTGYSKFWIRRFRDAWDSCAHKKSVAAAIFTLVWNLSSIVARIWAVFMLFVAFRYYQQTLLSKEEDWREEEDEEVNEEVSSWISKDSSHRREHRLGSTTSTLLKEKMMIMSE
ncbi:hypothetical protein GIB67_022373 [Kingdonia uniflora]|uniref:Reticulon-like protein n=1 Tax=Kingdonia uniflora TaxID=39325 RepID=A0A7J7N6R0_9MAGN|nr:hypothetical protein GIB67_022373 [Kingdonia uniflora]